MSARSDLELWCGGEVAQSKCNRQTDCLGIIYFASFSLSDCCWVTQMEKPLTLWGTPQYPHVIPFLGLHSLSVLAVKWKKTSRRRELHPELWKPMRSTNIDSSASHLYCIALVLTELIISRLKGNFNPLVAQLVWVLGDWSQLEASAQLCTWKHPKANQTKKGFYEICVFYLHIFKFIFSLFIETNMLWLT